MNLTAKQEKFLQAYLLNPNLTQAAKSAGISRATAMKYRDLDAFKTAYAEARNSAVEGTITYLRSNLREAAEALMTVLRSDQTSPAVKVQCADTIFKNTLRLGEQAEILDALQEVEELLRQGA